MAYVKTTWATGDVITAAKLNNMEGGIEAAYPVYFKKTVSGDTATIDASYNDVFALLRAHIPVYFYEDYAEGATEISVVTQAYVDGGKYSAAATNGQDLTVYSSDTAEGDLTYTTF